MNVFINIIIDLEIRLIETTSKFINITQTNIKIVSFFNTFI